MIERRRTLLLAAAIGFGALIGPVTAIAVAGASPRQEIPATTSLGVTTTTGATTTQADASSSGSSTSSDKPLFTESRKIVAIIAGLIFVALSLTLLTIRYWRATKPASSVPDPVLNVDGLTAYERAVLGARMQSEMERVQPEPLPIQTPAPAADPVVPSVDCAEGEPAAVAGADIDAPVAEPVNADHLSADSDWSPRGTGEHDRIDVAAPRLKRPGATARRKALGLPVDT